MLNLKIFRKYLVVFISIILFLVGVSSVSATNLLYTDTSERLSKPLHKNGVLLVLMSQEVSNASDITIIMEKPILPPPSVEPYEDWRDMDWKDPFARNGSVRRLDRNNTKKPESSMTLELSMPSSVDSTEGLSGELKDPFAPSVSAPDMSDPFEGYNRFMFDFNEGFYDSIMEPVVRGYRDAVNENIRMAISNIFDNAMAPLKLVSSILQGDLDKSGRVIGRTIINTTIGIGGMFDVADKAFQIKDVNEDLDQVLGTYGVPTGPYIVIPIFGPSYLRSIIGQAGGTFLSPIAQFAPGVEVGAGLTASDKINDTSFIVDDIDQLEESSIDKYESVRDFYNQYRFKLQNE
jgi:ABC-type transporter lipoprotein component MlaA